ncbi:thioesterase domain-containing protein [Streptomyces sp. KM273126]|uniref:thioesterase domain-containing protein n=1 Tax=Streptomyces sp. KM273126 TaxID=2545247 RepID=UPI0037D9F6FC
MAVVQYRGRLDRLREAPVEDLHLLADLIAGALGPSGDRPRALFGHSMGASLAYEVAVRLARRRAATARRVGPPRTGRRPGKEPGLACGRRRTGPADMRVGRHGRRGPRRPGAAGADPARAARRLPGPRLL